MKKILPLFFLAIASHLLSVDIDWSSPLTISNPSNVASNVELAIDTNGNISAIWLENGLLLSASQPFGGTWTAATTLSISTVTNASIGVDGSGNATVVWLEEGIVQTASLPFGGAWSSTTAISQSGASSPAFSVDSTGNGVAIWARGGFIESATQLVGGSWGLVNMLSSGGSEDLPQVAISANGTVVAVWHSTASGLSLPYYSLKQVSAGTWQTQDTITTTSADINHSHPNIAIDSNGNAAAIWMRYQVSGSVYSNVQTLAATLASGTSSWVDLTALSGLSRVNPANLISQLAYDDVGNLIALWTSSYDGDTYNIESGVLQPGNAWALGGELVLQNIYGLSAQIATTPSGNTIAGYMYFDGTNISIQLSESDIGAQRTNFWSIPVTVSTVPNNGFPATAATATGTTTNAVCAWISNGGGNNIVEVVTGSEIAVPPPTSLSVTQSSNNFGVFTEYYNTLSWAPSPSPDVFLYNLYRNGSYFQTVLATTTTFIDHNAVQNGPVVYGVAAVDMDEDQSIIATVNFP